MSDWLCKPLLIKELRETLRWSPIGMIVVGLLCWQTIPDQTYLYRPLAVQFVYMVGIGAALVALALGLLQSLGDMRTDARGFLLHRPISLRSIFATKLLAGFVAYVICLAPPLILTAIRLDVLGPQRLPVGPLDLLPLVLASLIIFLLHPAAMWTTYRTARWVGTRTLPLVFAGIGIALSIVLLLESSGWWLLGFLPLVVIIWYIVTVHAAWHAFAHQTFLPSVASGESMSASRAIGLFVACVVLLTTIVVMSAETFFARSQHDLVTYDLAIDSDGELWEIQNVYRKGILVVGKEAEKLGRRIMIGQLGTDKLEPLPDDWERAGAVSFSQSFSHFGASRWYDRFGNLGYIMVDDGVYNYLSMVEHESQILVYLQQGGVTHVITPDGVFDPEDNPTGRFRGVRLLSNTTTAKGHMQLERNPLLIASDGIFQVDFNGRRVNRLIDAEVSSAAIQLPETKGGAASLWVFTGDRLSHYRVLSSIADEPLDSASDPIITKTQRYPLPLLAAEKTQEFAIDPVDRPSVVTVAASNKSKIVVMSSIGAYQYHVEVLDTASGLAESGIVRIDQPKQASPVPDEFYILPPGLIGLGSAVVYFVIDNEQWQAITNSIPQIFTVVLVLHAVIAAAIAFWISGRRGAARTTKVLWAVLGTIFGVVVLPAIIAIHAKLIYETCPQCDNPRRIDKMTCDSCGADWDRLPRDGNEVIGGWLPGKLAQAEHSA